MRPEDVRGMINSVLSQFNLAFALMSVVPLLISCYLLAARLFSIDILVGLNGIYFLLAVIFALLGLLVGRGVLRGVIQQLIKASTEASAAVQAEKNRAEELHRAYQELKHTHAMLIQAEKMAAVGRLASGIAHEVKNPLSIIMLGINSLERELGPEGGQQAEILQAMKESIQRSDKIIRGLLDFSKPTQLELKPTAISQVIDASLELAQKQVPVKEVHVTKDVAATLPLVMIDENQMKQVFINLILNAFQAMPDGGRLVIRSFTKELTEAGHGIGRRATDVFRLGETALVCQIEDTGVGIPKEILPKVFDPFFTTKSAGQGTGLGLSIARAIVEAHRGLTQIESEEGRGTIVWILLPIAQEEQQKAGTRRDAERTPWAGGGHAAG